MDFAESVRSGASLIPKEPLGSVFASNGWRRLSLESICLNNLTTDVIDALSPIAKRQSPSTTSDRRKRRRRRTLLRRRRGPQVTAAHQWPTEGRGEGGGAAKRRRKAQRPDDDYEESKLSRRSAAKVEKRLQTRFLRRLLQLTMTGRERRLRRLTDRHLNRMDFDVQVMPFVSSWAGALLMPAPVAKGKLTLGAGENGLIISAHLAKGSRSKELAHIIVDPNNGMQVAIRLDPLVSMSVASKSR